jgi:hypothetical protein
VKKTIITTKLYKYSNPGFGNSCFLWIRHNFHLRGKINAADEQHYMSSDNDIYANTEVENHNLQSFYVNKMHVPKYTTNSYISNKKKWNVQNICYSAVS